MHSMLNVATLLKTAVLTVMDYMYSRMDRKRGHVTCGNQLAIEREESFKKFASFKVELLLCVGLLGSSRISHRLIREKMTPAR